LTLVNSIRGRALNTMAHHYPRRPPVSCFHRPNTHVEEHTTPKQAPDQAGLYCVVLTTLNRRLRRHRHGIGRHYPLLFARL
jgi:hypothetical protein